MTPGVSDFSSQIEAGENLLRVGLGRNTIDGPGLNWTQASLQKSILVKERFRFEVRYDINNVFKQPNFVNPSSTVNLKSPGLFGKPTSTQGGWCCLGGQFVSTLVGKFTF